MRAVVQRVSAATVSVDGESVGDMGAGLLCLVAARRGDEPDQADEMARKLVHLRIFPDDEEKMNRSLTESGGAMLVVSQFTLLGDCRKGRRPSLVAAAEPALAEALYQVFAKAAEALGVRVATGRFGAMMQLALVNDGPVTLLLDSKKTF